MSGDDGKTEARYLICKHGSYYRPNSQGYTTSAIQAGRYTLAESVLITHPNGPDGPRDGMTYVHEDEVRDEDLVAYRFLQVENAALQSRVAELEAANRGLVRLNEATEARAEAAEAALAAMTKELEAARLATGLVRMCVNCGATRPADYGMVTPRAGCPSPDACTWDMTPQEAADYWRKIAHDRYAALAAERAKVAKLVEAGKDALIVLDEFHIGPESPVIADLRAAIAAAKGE